MTGANFLCPKMEPPDTMDVSMRLDNRQGRTVRWDAEREDIVCAGEPVPACHAPRS